MGAPLYPEWSEKAPLKEELPEVSGKRAWWLTLVIPALKRLRHKDLCEFEASLG